MTYTITVQQLNAVFGLAMPAIVAFVAGLIRQDGFKPGVNELISYLVIFAFAIVQTLLSGQGFDSILHFLIIAGWTFAGIHTHYGSLFQSKVQTATSLLKAPPAPPALTLESIAAVIAQQLQAYMRQQPIDAQPTTQMPAITRTNTPPLGG